MLKELSMKYWNLLVTQVPIFNNKYIISLLIIVFAIVAAKLLLVIFERYLERLAKKTKTEIDDLLFDRTKRPLFYLVLAYGVKLAFLNLNINGWINSAVNTLMAIVFVWLVASIVDVIIESWGRNFAKKTKSTIDDVLLPLFHKAAKVVFVIIGIMWTLKIWNVNITPYLAGAGIGGLVIGLALQDSLRNILGGINLLLDKNFELGDKIKLESGDVGEISDIGLRSTKITTYDHEVMYVPNGYLANTRILNYTHPTQKVRVKVEFGVEYGSDVKKVKKVVLEAVNTMKAVMDDPKPAVQFGEMADSSLNFKALFWVDSWKNAYKNKLKATELIYAALNKAGIGIPFPTRTIYMKQE